MVTGDINTTPKDEKKTPKGGNLARSSSEKQANTQVWPRHNRACMGSSPPGSRTLSVWSPHSAARSGPAAARACPSDAANTMTRAGAASSPALRLPAHASQRSWGPRCRHTLPAHVRQRHSTASCPQTVALTLFQPAQQRRGEHQQPLDRQMHTHTAWRCCSKSCSSLS